MRQICWSLVLVAVLVVMTAAPAQSVVSVTIEKQIEAGSDQTAVFDFPGVGMLGHMQSANYSFTGGVSLVFEQLPDTSWDVPTINCAVVGDSVTAVVSGPYEVTITDGTGGVGDASVTCTYINRQVPTAPATPGMWLALLALALLASALLMQRRLEHR